MEFIETGVGFDSIFSLVFTLIIIIMILILGFRLVNLVLNLSADKIKIDATLISKDVAVTHHTDDQMHRTSHTSHSFTFETVNGERIVLDVSYKIYRQYAIGDFGELVYQRKWLKEFTLKK